MKSKKLLLGLITLMTTLVLSACAGNAETARDDNAESENELNDNMEGMEGATATIDSAEQTTTYMVSYTDTETGEEVKNHKWVTETELSPVE